MTDYDFYNYIWHRWCGKCPNHPNTVFLYGIVQISRTFLGLLKSPGLCWFQPNQSEDRGSEKKRLYDTTLQQDLCLLKIKRIYYKGTFLLRRLVLVGLLLLEHVALLPAEGIGPAHQLPVDPLVEVAA